MLAWYRAAPGCKSWHVILGPNPDMQPVPTATATRAKLHLIIENPTTYSLLHANITGIRVGCSIRRDVGDGSRYGLAGGGLAFRIAVAL